MGKKFTLSIALLVTLFILGSCGYRPGHFRHNHYHWGASRHYSVRHAFWGKRHYGPRPYGHRGKYN